VRRQPSHLHSGEQCVASRGLSAIVFGTSGPAVAGHSHVILSFGRNSSGRATADRDKPRHRASRRDNTRHRAQNRRVETSARRLWGDSRHSPVLPPTQGQSCRTCSRRCRRTHSSGSPALRKASNAGCKIGLVCVRNLMEILGLTRRASARADLAVSKSPLSALAAARFM
jgi:hypothetical protein